MTRGIAPIGLALLLACSAEHEPTGPTSGPATAATAAKTLVFSQVVNGFSTSCGITTAGIGYCWGDNDVGYIGDGTTIGRRTPVRVAGGLRFRQISMGVAANCGVTTDGKAYCWGDNTVGTVGDGTTVERDAPAAVAGGKRFSEITSGLEHTCAIGDPDGRVWCWGDNDDGELGNGTNSGPESGPFGVFSSKPVQALGGHAFRHIAAGNNFTCGIATDGRLYCWGKNRNGELGDGTQQMRRRKPTLVATSLRFATVAAGDGRACATTVDNRAWCWGWGSSTPAAVPGGLSFTSLSIGASHLCGVTTSNKAYCWSGNQFGQLGDGTRKDRVAPTAVKGGFAFDHVSAAGYHTCGETTDGKGYCWGWNFFGQLGDGTNTDRSTPMPISGGN